MPPPLEKTLYTFELLKKNSYSRFGLKMKIKDERSLDYSKSFLKVTSLLLLIGQIKYALSYTRYHLRIRHSNAFNALAATCASRRAITNNSS